MKIPNIKKKLCWIIAYAIISLPIIFSVYYSVPASDDFAAATRPNWGNVFEQSMKHGFGMWVTWGGRWLSQFVQTLINPLNSHHHLGHIYGIYMIVVYILTTIMIVYGLKVCVEYILRNESKYTSIITYIIMVVFLTTYYYSECYNWYVGAMVYTIPLAFTMLAISAMIRYVESNTFSLKQYVLIIVAGIFPATIEIFDVALGITYLYFIYYRDFNNRKTEALRLKIKNAAPLLLYIILGCSSVFAPGNKVRQEYYNLDLSVTKSFIQFAIDVIVRIQDLIVDHPLAVILFIALIILGIYSNKDNVEEQGFVEYIILLMIIIIGSVYPYIYGRALDSTYLDIRMEYILDFCLEVGIGILCVKFGRYLSYRYNLVISSNVNLYVAGLLVLFVYVSLIQNYSYLEISSIDLIRNRGQIISSYNYWNDVLMEIENSEEDDVVIKSENVPEWSRYFLAVGIENGDLYNASKDKIYDEEIIMPNVYYGKNSVQMQIENQD